MEKDLWVTAKTIARDNSKSNDWVFVSDVYLHLGGTQRTVEARVGDGVTVRLISHLTSDQDLVLRDNDQGETELVLYPSEVIFKSPKQFGKVSVNAKPITFDLEGIKAQVGNTPIISLFAKNKQEIVITN